MLLTKAIDLRPDHVPHLTGALEFFPGGAFKPGGIRKRPMQTSSYPRKTRTTFGLRFTTDGDDVLKHLTQFPNVEDRLSFALRYIDAEFLKRFHSQRIERA